MGRGEKLNKEKDSHFNDNDIIKSENSFESAFSDKGPEFESAFQEEKAEKRYVTRKLGISYFILKASASNLVFSCDYCLLRAFYHYPQARAKTEKVSLGVHCSCIDWTNIHCHFGRFYLSRNHEKIQGDSVGISVGE